MTLSLLSEQFRERFGCPPQAIARAPGRIEFVGNHTDYNGGAVLGAAIDRSVWVAAAPGTGPRIRLATAQSDTVVTVPADVKLPLGGPESWANYPLGVWRSLRDFGLPAPAAFDLFVTSDLPAGAGLSSSAALELAVALALLKLAGHPGPDLATLAKLGRHAENTYVGVPCGILDQGTSAHGRADSLVHIDCRGPVFSRVPFPAGTALWVFNTRDKHALIDGLYAKRRAECESAARKLGVKLLADLTPATLAPRLGELDPTEAKRARHVVEEHARVAGVGEALARGDLAAAGRLLVASHRSSQHLFENSTPALDALVDRLECEPGVHGARLTGGGFGGAAMAFTTAEFTSAQAEAVAANHAKLFGRPPEVLRLQVADGATLLSP